MDDDEKFLCMMRALSDPNRLTILRILKGRRHHMSVLLDAGLVRTVPTGRWYDYEIDEEALGFLNAALGDIL